MGSGSSSLYEDADDKFAQAKKKKIAYKKFSAAQSKKEKQQPQQEQKKQRQQNHFAAYPKTINKDKQGRHIPGSKNYTPGRSILTVSLQRAQQLLDRYSGTGTKLNDHKKGQLW
ncbi:MAG: polymorphic toxin type 50 domain-containing protein [bacterium]|nr:polymorphic toxin type 50 domain-containing protein [bacterium]